MLHEKKPGKSPPVNEVRPQQKKVIYLLFYVLNCFSLRPGRTEHYISELFPPPNLGQKPGQKSGQKDKGVGALADYPSSSWPLDL